MSDAIAPTYATHESCYTSERVRKVYLEDVLGDEIRSRVTHPNFYLAMKPLNPESLMDQCVRAADGVCVRDLVGANPTFDNADYLFRNDDVVAELKSLEKDFLSDPTVHEKMHLLYNRWVNEGKEVPLIYGMGPLRTDQLPLECAREIVGIFKNRLERTAFQKANTQLRETRKHLKCSNALGLLLLSNEGNFALDPAMMAHVLFHSMRAKYSSIEHVIYFSANLVTNIPGTTLSAPPFASIRLPKRRQPSADFLHRLGSRWYEILGAATGQTFPPFAFGHANPDDIDRARFRPR